MSDRVLFSNSDAQRIWDAVLKVERQAGGDVGRGTSPRIQPWNKVVKLMTSLSAGDGGINPGSGEGKIYTFDGSKFVATTDAVRVFNLTDVAIAVGSYVQCVTVDGHFFYDVTKCSNGGSSSYGA